MNSKSHNQTSADGWAFSSIDVVGMCLLDRERSEAFDRAIRGVVAPHHTVLDAGTGAGLLALFAARAGARRVIALEYDPYIAAVARANIRRNGFAHVIEVIEADARAYQFAAGTHFDVVLAEMLTTGCIDEYQVQAVNNLHRQGVVSPRTLFVPEQQLTFATLAQTRFELYDLHFPMVRHQWKWFDRLTFQPLSERCLLNGLSFAGGGQDEAFSVTLSYAAVADGLVNSLYLTSVSVLTPEISLHDTHALNGPVIVPLAERLVRAGEQVCLRISYRFGGGFAQFSAEYV
ncbi:MAG: 50S ribosomal protein L11 methyltransferase [Acidobacteria bacterium]|nr:50S ribosomal protein L11 methyltransferase [Acidobacteriota bacterium]MBI3421583.1 50S ribosomal protein L11 methyltransferase [Acidobacteriota bacterium]